MDTSKPTATIKPPVEHELRASCDRCWSKKRRCPGGNPCLRCRRGSFVCNYSRKRKLGRPAGSGANRDSKRKQQQGSTATPQRKYQQQQQKHPNHQKLQQEAEEGGEEERQRETSADAGRESDPEEESTEILSLKSPSFVCSSATGLAGLPESRFLSCFLEHYAPMCGFADAASIRDGLVHAFVGRWMVNTPSYVKPVRDPAEVMLGHALECSLFSAMAIGGLALGCPATAVYRHLNAARRNLTKCQDLREPPVVSALVLYGVANALLPPCGGDGSGGPRQQEEAQLRQQEQQHEYVTSLDSAQALYEILPSRDPLMTAFLTYRAMCDNLVAFLLNSGYSVNPANVHGRYEAGVAGDGGGGQEHPEAVDEMTQRVHVPPTKAAHPSYVVADMMTLIFRYVCADNRGGTEGQSGWRQTHDFIEAEFYRLSREKAGAMVMTTLAGNLLAVKSRVGTTEGMLPIAEMALPFFMECPGLMRHYTLHNAHLVLTVFKLFDKKESYDQLREQLIMVTEHEIATFEDFVMGVPICVTQLCIMTSDIILGMNASPAPGGTSSGGASDPAGVRESPRPVVAAGKEEIRWGPQKEGTAVSPHSDTTAATPAVGWTEVALRDSEKGVDPRLTAAAVPSGASRCTGPPMSKYRTEWRHQQELVALPWDEQGGGLHALGRGGDCHQQYQHQHQQNPNSGGTVNAVGVPFSPRGTCVPFSPRGTGESLMPMQAEGPAVRGGPHYPGSSSGREGAGWAGQRDGGEYFGGEIPLVPCDNDPEGVGGGRAGLQRGDRRGAHEYQPHARQSHPLVSTSSSLKSSSTSVGIAPVLESLRAQTAAKQELRRLQHGGRELQPSVYTAVSGGMSVPDVRVHGQVHRASLPESAGAAPDSAGAVPGASVFSVAESVHPPSPAAATSPATPPECPVSGSCGTNGTKSPIGGEGEGQGGGSNNDHEDESGAAVHSDLEDMLLDH